MGAMLPERLTGWRCCQCRREWYPIQINHCPSCTHARCLTCQLYIDTRGQTDVGTEITSGSVIDLTGEETTSPTDSIVKADDGAETTSKDQREEDPGNKDTKGRVDVGTKTTSGAVVDATSEENTGTQESLKKADDGNETTSEAAHDLTEEEDTDPNNSNMALRLRYDEKRGRWNERGR